MIDMSHKHLEGGLATMCIGDAVAKSGVNAVAKELEDVAGEKYGS